jgi:hypothetical protein
MSGLAKFFLWYVAIVLVVCVVLVAAVVWSVAYGVTMAVWAHQAKAVRS